MTTDPLIAVEKGSLYTVASQARVCTNAQKPLKILFGVALGYCNKLGKLVVGNSYKHLSPWL